MRGQRGDGLLGAADGALGLGGEAHKLTTWTIPVAGTPRDLAGFEHAWRSSSAGRARLAALEARGLRGEAESATGWTVPVAWSTVGVVLRVVRGGVLVCGR